MNVCETLFLRQARVLRCSSLTSIDNSLIDDFQQHPELWVHVVGLLRVNLEEGSVELVKLFEFPVSLRKSPQTFPNTRTNK